MYVLAVIVVFLTLVVILKGISDRFFKPQKDLLQRINQLEERVRVLEDKA